MASAELGRTKAYDDKLCWRIVYQRYTMDLNYREIVNNVNVDMPLLNLKVKPVLMRKGNSPEDKYS